MALKLRIKEVEHRIVYKDEDGEAVFYARDLKPAEVTRLIEKCTIFEWDSPDKRTKKERFEKMDHLKFLRLRFRKLITRWEGLQIEDGVDFPCNTENKDFIFDNCRYIVDFISEKLDEIAELEKERKEESEGN